MVERNAEYELARTQRLGDRNAQAMEDLASLDLPDLPRRIEGYDISHIQGAQAVASQVVFIDGNPAKQHYRHYKIKNPTVTAGHWMILLSRRGDPPPLPQICGNDVRTSDLQLQRVKSRLARSSHD